MIASVSSDLDQLTANASTADEAVVEAQPRRTRGWFATMTSKDNLLITVGVVVLGHFACIVTP